MIERYLAELSHELGTVGIRGRLRRRILLETEDHLRSDPDGLERFGSPKIVAARFADELATTRSRGAANATFISLAVAAVVYAVSLLPDRADIFANHLLVVALPAAVLLVFAPQLAFVAGVLALVRSLRRRGVAIIPAEEVHLLTRRTEIALVAGWVTVASLAAYYATRGGSAYTWWLLIGLGSCMIAALALAWASLRFARAKRLRPSAAGSAGDAFDDLGAAVELVPAVRRTEARRHPWLFCIAVAALVALATFASGAVAGKPDEGLFNAIAEAAAVCLGFAAFGVPLGLRPSR